MKERILTAILIVALVIVGEVERNKLMDRYVGQSKAVADRS
jgi:hypothetical protein